MRGYVATLLLLAGCQDLEAVRVLEVTVEDGALAADAEVRVRYANDQLIAAAPIHEGLATVVVPVGRTLAFEVEDPTFMGPARPVVTAEWSPFVEGCAPGPIASMPPLKPACVTERECVVLTDEAYACLLTCREPQEALNLCRAKVNSTCRRFSVQLSQCEGKTSTPECQRLQAEHDLTCGREACPQELAALNFCEGVCLAHEKRRQDGCRERTLECEEAHRVYRFDDRLDPLGCGTPL